MELEIEKVFSDIRISGEFYGNELEKVQKIIDPARKILNTMEDYFGNVNCEIAIRENKARKVRVSAFDSAHVLDIIFELEVGKDYLRCYQDDERLQEIADELEPYVLEIYKNI